MGSKNNPKNRGAEGKKKTYNGKEIEPIMYYDTEKKQKYLSAKISKTADVVCDENRTPVKWDDIANE